MIHCVNVYIIPFVSGDRKFSKAIHEAAGQRSPNGPAPSQPSSMRSSPTSPGRSQRPSASGPSSPPRPSITQWTPQGLQNDDGGPRDNYNETYLDRSHDDSLDVENPSYLGTSPGTRPNLPYPGQQYEMVRPGDPRIWGMRQGVILKPM